MNSFYTLLLAATFVAILGYFLLKGLFILFKKIVENTSGGLAGLCAIVWLIAMAYIISQRHNADTLLQDLNFWEMPALTVQSDTFDWQD